MPESNTANATLLENLTVSVNEPSGCLKEFSIEVSADRMSAEFELVLEEFRSKAKLPGFRPGRAPLAMVRSRFQDDVREELKERMMSRALGAVLDERGLSPVVPPRADKVAYDAGGPLSFQARVEVEPVIGEFSWTGLKGKRPRIEVNDSEIEAEVNRLREMHAELVPVERGAEPGDLMIVDYERTSGGDAEDRATDVLLELGDPGLLPEMEAGLRGAVKGSVRTVRIHYPDDFRDAALAGKDVELAVTVKELKEKRLPPLDDEFARAAGGVETLSELRTRIGEALQRAKTRGAERDLEQSLFDALIASVAFDVPPSVVASTAQEMAKTTAERLGGQAPDFQDQRVRELYFRMADRDVRRMFLAREIVRRAPLRVTDEELAERAGRIAAEFAAERGVTPAEALAAMRTRETLERIADQIMDEKVVQLLRDGAEIEEVAPAA